MDAILVSPLNAGIEHLSLGIVKNASTTAIVLMCWDPRIRIKGIGQPTIEKALKVEQSG